MRQITLESATDDENGVQFQFSDGLGFAFQDLQHCHNSADSYFEDPAIDTLIKYLLILNWLHNNEISTGYLDEHSNSGMWCWKVT